jgi:hypothetical protein
MDTTFYDKLYDSDELMEQALIGKSTKTARTRALFERRLYSFLKRLGRKPFPGEYAAFYRREIELKAAIALSGFENMNHPDPNVYPEYYSSTKLLNELSQND